jgi:hypothetical protein
MDGVDFILHYLTTDPDWTYEALEQYFNEAEKDPDSRPYIRRAKASLVQILLTGSGWRREDAAIVCAKFLTDTFIRAAAATSKEEAFDDGNSLYKFQVCR